MVAKRLQSRNDVQTVFSENWFWAQFRKFQRNYDKNWTWTQGVQTSVSICLSMPAWLAKGSVRTMFRNIFRVRSPFGNITIFFDSKTLQNSLKCTDDPKTEFQKFKKMVQMPPLLQTPLWWSINDRSYPMI